MNVQAWAAIIASMLVLIANLCTMFYWAGSITIQLKHIQDCLHRFDSEFSKRDNQINAIWKKTDQLRDLIYHKKETL